ncbi:hypothetical protein C495_10519 [Natronorubrum sulfidifaciens JCM 14089]|uniref:DUF8173 domain-containing protein n=1 Tax=Natronorubrum sulfidifaciens JCM 14089 TaxID=1230460 RepID=L9W4C5_9EURY|nr:hypothetical protein C495_10519 [Natronorubrum sulfidifaciens JCM 14089]
MFAVAVPDITRALGVTGGWMVLTLGVGWLLLERSPSSTRSIRDELATRPMRAFPAGFVVFFGALIIASMPLFFTTVLVSPVGQALSAIVAIPSVLLWSVLVVVGGCYGVIAVGDWLPSRLSVDTPSPWPALVVGTLVVGSSQLVPVLGAVVILGVATIGTGAVVRRRLGADRGGRSVSNSGSEPAASTTAPASGDRVTVEREPDGRERDSKK